MDIHASWAVAAAILYRARHEGPIHFKALCYRVIATNLTGLRCKEGKTPSQTLNSEIGKHKDVFYRPFRGHCRLRNPDEAAKLLEVSRAIQAMQRADEEAKSSAEIV